MRTRLPNRILSLLLVLATLISMLSSTFAFAAEVPLEETAVTAEAPSSEEEHSAEEAVIEETPDAETATEETAAEEPGTEDAPVAPADIEAASEETEEEMAEAPDSYTYDGYEAPNLFADEVPEYFLDQSNWNVLDDSEPVLPVTDRSEEEMMAEASQELTTAAVMTTSEGYDYDEELAKFPESYQVYLRDLHALHPNWIFVAVDTGLSWEEAINGELGAASTIDYNLNTATHHLLLNNRNGYYSTSAYSSTNGYKPIDGRHVSCSRAAIAYYMDPRNFLMDKYIFQFEDQAYSSVQQLEGVQKILKNADSTSKGLYHMKNYVTTSGAAKTLASLGSDFGSDYSTIIYRSGMAAGVSPYYLASKIAQETGATTTNASISGTYSGYTGIYNFYNIGAYASTTGQAVANGLKYARDHGWTNPILAVKGGADFLASSYIGKGQNTGYYMRFNVGPDAYYNTFSHQYMSATYAVASEATSTYSGYKSADAVDSPFLFYIPVYDNMPDQDSTIELTATTTGTTNAKASLYTYASNASSSPTLVSVPSGTSVTVLGGSVTQTDNYLSRLYYPYYYQVKVTVSGKSYVGYIQEQYVNLNANYNLKTGATQSLSAIRSTTGNVGTIYYETSDPAVATVSDTGVITAKGNGNCKIYAISTGGSFDAIGVKVSSSGSSGSGNTTSTPGTPVLKTITNTANGVKITWSSTENTQTYGVFRKTATSWTQIASVSASTATSYTDTSVTSGSSYTYTIRSLNGSVWGGFDRAGITTTYLSVPVLSSISPTTTSITITWKAVKGAEGYSILRKSSTSPSLTQIANCTSLSYTDSSGLTPDTTYIYTVKAYGADTVSANDTTGLSACLTPDVETESYVVRQALHYRTGPSTSYSTVGTLATGTTIQVVKGWSQSANGLTWVKFILDGRLYYTASNYLLATPKINAIANYVGGVLFTWNKISTASGYNIFRRPADSNTWTYLGYVSSSNTTSYLDKTAVPNSSYVYTVRAGYGKALSGFISNGPSIRYIETPALTSATRSSNSITVSWKAVGGADSYLVFRKTASSGWSQIGTTSAVSYTDSSSLKAGTTYTYTVRALSGTTMSYYNTAGLSATIPASTSISTENYVVRQQIYYRTGAGTSYSKVGTLKEGTTIQVITGWSKKANNYTWVKFLLNGNTYYVASDYLLATPKINAIANYVGGVLFTWNKISTASGYNIFRRPADSNTWTYLGYVSSCNTTSYLDKTAVPNNSYVYTVRAGYGKALSGFIGNGLSILYLETPTLTSANSAGSSITVSWKAVAGADSYLVFRKTASSGWAQIATTSSTSYTDASSLKAGTTYTYTVRALSGTTMSYYITSGISAKASGSSDTPTLVDYVTTGNINYRTGPGKTYDLAGNFALGATVKVVEGESYDVDGTPWYRIYVSGNYYYISSKYLTKA